MLGDQMEALVDDDFVGLVKPERYKSVRKVVKKCENPLCTHLIYADGYKYGVGDYCDIYCKKEGVGFKMRRRILLKRLA